MFNSPNPPQYPTIAIKITNPYPIELNGLCILCQSPVQFLYNSAEKSIYTLTVLIAERHHLVKCSNKNCPLYHTPFNPTPRFDYSQRNYNAREFAVPRHLKDSPRKYFAIAMFHHFV